MKAKSGEVEIAAKLDFTQIYVSDNVKTLKLDGAKSKVTLSDRRSPEHRPAKKPPGTPGGFFLGAGFGYFAALAGFFSALVLTLPGL